VKLGDWIFLIGFIGALIILWQFQRVLLLLFAAIILAIALNSLVRWLQRYLPIQRGQALILAIVLVLIAGLCFLSLVLPPFLVQFQALVQLVPEEIDRVIRWAEVSLADPPPWLPEFPEPDLPTLSRLTQQVEPVARNLIKNFFAFFQSSLAVLVQLLLASIITLMLAANPASYRRLAIRLFPSSYRHRADEILVLCEAALLSWMRGIFLSSIFVAALSAIGLSILGIQYVFTHALLAGVFNLIPNVGPAASMIFPLAVALADTPWKAIAVVVIYIVIQNLESYWFSPMVMRKQVSLLPVATLTAQLFFATFLGFLGLILALPLTVVTKTWVEEAWIKDILDKPPKGLNLASASRGPQEGRMVADDPDESFSM